MLLNQILSYPSTEQAEMHRNANRLGQLDVDKEGRYNRISDKVLLWLVRTCGASRSAPISASAAGLWFRSRPSRPAPTL